MCFVNTYISNIAFVSSQIKPDIPPGITMGLTIFSICVFVLSLALATYILFSESKKGKAPKENVISPEKRPTELQLETSVSTTDKKDDTKLVEVEQNIEAIHAAAEEVKKEKSTSQRNSILRIFKVINPGNVFHKLKMKKKETAEKADIPCTNSISAPLQSVDTPDNISDILSIEPDIEKPVIPEEPVAEYLYKDTIPISSDQQLPPEIDERIIDGTPSSQPDIEEPVIPEEPAAENLYNDIVSISSDQQFAYEIYEPIIEAEITPIEAEPIHYEPPIIFTITNLLVRPQEIHPGDTVFISFTVTNYGIVADYCTITLNIGGFTIYTDQIYLSSMESKYLNLPITAVQQGNWDIDINGVVAKMTIL